MTFESGGKLEIVKYLEYLQLVRLSGQLTIKLFDRSFSLSDVSYGLLTLGRPLLQSDVLLPDGRLYPLDFICCLFCLFLRLSCHHFRILKVCLELIVPLLKLLDLFESFTLSRSLLLFHIVEFDPVHIRHRHSRSKSV